MAMGTLVSNLFDPFGYDVSELSFICLLLLGAGVFGAIIVGAIIDRTHAYKAAMITLTAMIALSTFMVIATLTYDINNESMFIASLEVLGFVGTGYIPLCLSYAAELTFPMEPALVNGAVMLVGSGASFILSLLGAFLNHTGRHDDEYEDDELLRIRQWRSKSVIGILFVAALVAFVLAIIIKEDLRRHNHSADSPNKSNEKLTKEMEDDDAEITEEEKRLLEEQLV